jgi:type IV pilus assembly protein PilP
MSVAFRTGLLLVAAGAASVAIVTGMARATAATENPAPAVAAPAPSAGAAAHSSALAPVAAPAHAPDPALGAPASAIAAPASSSSTPTAPSSPSYAIGSASKLPVVQDLSTISKPDLMKIRDPFKRLVQPKVAEAPRTDLEAYAVDQFKLIGVLKGLDRPRAMLTGPNGRTYFVSENQRMGNRRGMIRHIGEESLVVREKFTNIIGKEENLDIELKLSAEIKGQGPKLGTSW